MFNEINSNHLPESTFYLQNIPLVCPSCKSGLNQRDNNLYCSFCTKQFPIKENIPLFSPDLDVFYEGKYITTHRIVPNIVHRYPFLKPFWWIFFQLNIAYRPQRIFLRFTKNWKGTVLDLGCGGATEFFTRLGPVIGMDISFKSLKIAHLIYPGVIQGNILNLPFPDKSFDIVISSHVIGHIPEPEKIQLLSEIHRILKTRGKLILFAETKADHYFHRLAKTNPSDYNKFFIQQPGHHGLEYGDILIHRLKSIGFKRVIIKKLYSSLWAIEHYLVNFPEEYQLDSGFFNYFRKICRLIYRIPPLHHTTNCLLGILNPFWTMLSSSHEIQEWFLYVEKK